MIKPVNELNGDKRRISRRKSEIFLDIRENKKIKMFEECRFYFRHFTVYTYTHSTPTFTAPNCDPLCSGDHAAA